MSIYSDIPVWQSLAGQDCGMGDCAEARLATRLGRILCSRQGRLLLQADALTRDSPFTSKSSTETPNFSANSTTIGREGIRSPLMMSEMYCRLTPIAAAKDDCVTYCWRISSANLL